MTFILLVSLQFGRGQQRQLMPAPLSVSWVGSISRTFALFGGLLTPTSGWGDASSWCLQKPGLLGHLILSPLFPMWPLQHGGFRVASFFDTGPGLQKYISRERETDGSCPSFSNSCNVTPPCSRQPQKPTHFQEKEKYCFSPFNGQYKVSARTCRTGNIVVAIL